MVTTGFRRAALLLLTLFTACAPAVAGIATGNGRLDRSVMPEAGPTPNVDFPEPQRRTLSNGLELWVVERPEVPLVTVQLLLLAGAVTDPADRVGLASLTAAMLTEGTTTRTATQIAEEVDFLAGNLAAGAGRETAVVTLSTLARNLMPALELFADIIVNPAFKQDDWERVRDQRLAALLQALDQPATIADLGFDRTLFGQADPFGRPVQGTSEAVRAITPADLREFHSLHYRPNGANLIAVGAVDADALVRQLEVALGQWRGTPPPVARPLGGPPPQTTTRIYLIDKPGAAQSELRIGHVSVERTHPDYFPLLILNTILGGQFSSRINLNLREDKGYTYGARSAFQMGRVTGSFVASGGVQTNVTKESIIEFMRELDEVRAGRPVTESEVEFARTSTIRREPLAQETNAQIVARVQTMLLFDLPLDYFDKYDDEIARVTTAEVNRVAREHLQAGRFTILVVGDRAVIEPELRALPYPVEIVTLEEEPTSPTPQQPPAVR